MKVDNNHLAKLKQLIEEAVTYPIVSSTDYERLHQQMQECLHEAVGVSTLKRLWGYVEGYATVRESTLDVMCRFVGYSDWHTFVADYCEVESAQTSRRVLGATLRSEELPVGNCVEIAWNPNRRLVLRHEGVGNYTVIEACNSKVKVGDTFHCERFVMGQPLYVDNMRHADEPPTLFVLGRLGGLTRCRVV